MCDSFELLLVCRSGVLLCTLRLEVVIPTCFCLV